MFCERCGSKLNEGQRFCPSCGKPVGISLVPIERQGKVQRNIQILAILWLVAGALNLFLGFGMFTFSHIFSNLGLHFDGAPNVAPFLHSIVAFASGFVLLKAVLSIVTGIGLLQRESWARPLAIVMSFFELLHIPFGTALGIYTLVVLLPNEASVEYDELAKAA
jgi:zinc ribbon protein